MSDVISPIRALALLGFIESKTTLGPADINERELYARLQAIADNLWPIRAFLESLPDPADKKDRADSNHIIGFAEGEDPVAVLDEILGAMDGEGLTHPGTTCRIYRGTVRKIRVLLDALGAGKRIAPRPKRPSMSYPIESDFYIGQTVVFRLDPDEVGLVTGIQVRCGSVSYSVTWANRQETMHYALELLPSPTACRA